jgi:hypothetical protein
MNRTTSISIQKVRAHKNITRNEEADKLAKEGSKKGKVDIIESHHNAHTSPYWLHRAEPYQVGHPFKEPSRNYQKFLDKQELK